MAEAGFSCSSILRCTAVGIIPPGLPVVSFDSSSLLDSIRNLSCHDCLAIGVHVPDHWVDGLGREGAVW